IRIDQEGLGILENLIQTCNLASRIQKSGHRQIMFLIELVHIFPIIVDADSHHLKFSILEPPVQRLHFMHFFDTELAPCTPDIQEYNLASVIAESDCTTLLILDGEIRRLLPNVDDTGLTSSGDFSVDEECRYGTDNQKENNGFHALAHVVYCSISATHEL